MARFAGENLGPAGGLWATITHGVIHVLLTERPLRVKRCNGAPKAAALARSRQIWARPRAGWCGAGGERCGSLGRAHLS
jgi:hypothetical protein